MDHWFLIRGEGTNKADQDLPDNEKYNFLNFLYSPIQKVGPYNNC